MNPKLFSELTEEEQRLYGIAFDAGEDKGAMKGFLYGLAIGVSIAALFITIIN